MAQAVRAGRVRALVDGAVLRDVQVAGVEVVRRISVAVRDADWGTVPGVLGSHDLQVDDDAFRLTFTATHRAHDLAFTWQGTVEGRPDGTLSFRMDGRAEAAFAYNRIGIVVLHPPSFAGQPLQAAGPDGRRQERLPVLVGPQWFRDGLVHPLVQPYEDLELAHPDGPRVRFAFAGDRFEMEDQRNWADASFKTYSTPLAAGWPHHAEAGQTLAQQVTVTVTGDARPRPALPDARIGEVVRQGLPPIGFGLSAEEPGSGARALLRAARPAHLRADLRLEEPEAARAGLARAADEARALGAALELALHLPTEAGQAVARLAPELEGVALARLLVLDDRAGATGGDVVRAVRAALPASLAAVPLFGGTDGQFADLNRTRPDVDGLDGVAYSVNPQFHDCDDVTVMENAAAQGATVRTAAAIAPGVPVAVSPVTLRPRSVPWRDPGPLPADVDVRQALPFAAAWTVASLQHLVEAGAAALTYYELVGWRGLVEREQGPPDPEHFPSAPGQAFPLHAVFAHLAGWQAAAVHRVVLADERRTAGLALARDGRLRVVVANLTGEPAEPTLALPPGVHHASVVRLASGTAGHVTPAAPPAPLPVMPQGAATLPLGPHGVAILDATLP